jgi:nicotinate-nucleotide adenylyltransferase
MRRIGIYAGTFDPVHSGHLAFALQAMEVGHLDHVYFMPERNPREKTQVTHFGHRVAMLERALKPHPLFSVLEMVDSKFSIKRTLPRLQQQFVGSQLVFLFGSDLIASIKGWPDIDRLLVEAELIVGLRNDDDRDNIKMIIEQWDVTPRTITIFDSYAPYVTSGKIRSALRKRRPADGLLKSVEKYSDHHWLYVTLTNVDTL